VPRAVREIPGSLRDPRIRAPGPCAGPGALDRGMARVDRVAGPRGGFQGLAADGQAWWRAGHVSGLGAAERLDLEPGQPGGTRGGAGTRRGRRQRPSVGEKSPIRKALPRPGLTQVPLWTAPEPSPVLVSQPGSSYRTQLVHRAWP
jgi:hypothetical protein